jgi:hypothetical protein
MVEPDHDRIRVSLKENQNPPRAVDKTRITNATTTNQKANPDNTGIVTKVARMPSSPITRATIQVICFGALNLISIPPSNKW